MAISPHNTNRPLSKGTLITHDPFFIYSVEHFLPQLFFEELCGTFPDRSWFAHVTKSNKQRLNSEHDPVRFRDFIEQSPVWKEFTGILQSHAFLTELYSLTRPYMRQARGIGYPQSWFFNDTTIGTDFLSQTIVPNFEFSRLEQGAYLPVHTDAPEKMVSTIFYLGDENWKPEYGGGTAFYRPKDARLNHNWFNRKVDTDKLELFYESSFTPNTLLMFIKSPNSYHGVTPIKSPPGFSRNSFNTSIFIEHSKHFRRLRVRKSMFEKKIEDRYWV